MELLDLYPTLAEVCRLRGTPDGLHGRSLANLLAHPEAEWRKPAITQVRRTRPGESVKGYSIRNERYRYTCWGDGRFGEELYDYRSDPRELRNLAAAESAARLKRDMRADLEVVLGRRGKS